MPSPSQVTPYIRNALDLNRFSNKLGNDVVQVYVDAAQQLLRDFATQDGATETRMARLNAQALQIRDTIASAYADKYPDLIKQLTELANQQAKFQAKTLKKQIPKGVGVNVRTVEVSKDYVEALAKGDPKAKLELSGDEIIRRSLPRILPDDQPALKKVIEDLADSSSKALEKSLRSGLLLGKTNDEIVRGLLAGNKIPKGSPLKKTESAVRTVVQSAVIGVGAEAQLLTIEANKDITDEYEFLATLDNRTSPQCRALDGKVFKVNDPTAPRPPIHYRCRSTLIPSLSKFFKDNNIELDTGTRASMDGQVPADLNYEQWLKTQTPAFQDEVLGKGKANLFRNGMGLAQMVREDGTTKNLKDLEAEPVIPPLPTNLGALSLAELKDLAAKRGVNIDDVKALGSPRAKKTWINALQGNIAEPKPIVTESATFPPDLSRLEKVKDLGGSTGAELVRDPDTGKLFVRKSGSSPEHLREEFYADQAYRALGIPVPDGRLYEVNGKPVKLTEFIEGKPLSAFDGKERDAIYQKLQQHFVADAILGNWDVVGLGADNILVGKDGTPYRIDNGGALRFRAQGQQKKGAWNDYPTEIFSLRDPSVNAMSANVFGGLKYQNLLSQLEQLEQDKSTLLNALPPQLQSAIARRIDEGGRVARVGRTLIADKFNAEYTENFTKHSLGYRANGMVGKMPQRIELAEGNKFIDQDGKPFDNLRGKGSIVADLEKYVDSIGGNYKIISDWMDSQSDSSWSEQSLAFKYMIAKVRNNDGDYIWLDKKEEAKKLYKELSRNNNKYEETFAAYHAFSYELLQKTAMPNNDQSRNTFTVYRTESKYVMQDLNGLSVGDRGVTMRRGAAESSSAFTPISAIAGKELTIQQVPHHRIVGTYLQSRTSRGDSAFLGDKENEFVFIPDGIEFDYVSSGNLRDYAVQPTATINKAKPTKKTQSSSDDTDILYKVGVLPQELFDEILDKYGGVSGVLNNAAKIEKEYHL